MKKSTLASQLAAIGRLAATQTSEIGRCSQLVKSFKQVAVDQSSARRRKFELGSVFDAIGRSFGPSIARSGFNPKLEFSCEAPIWCDTTPGSIIQIVSNLIQNSISHAFTAESKNPSISILARAISKDGQPWVSIEARDNGNGIPDEIRGKVFDAYFTTKPNDGGSGIGLSLSSKLAANLGGSLAIKESSPEGTCFVFEYPANQA